MQGELLLLHTNNKNVLKNSTFEIRRDWNAPLLESAEEIKTAINAFNLPGRRIKRIKAIGLDYNHVCDLIENEVYLQYKGLPEEERKSKSNYFTINPDAEFTRYMLIAEPLLIEFEDGDIFETWADMYGVFKMSMNEILWNVEPEITNWNIDANVMLSPCIGQKITRVEVDSMAGAIEIPPEDSVNTVTNIILHLEKGVKLRLRDWIDYFDIACLNENSEDLKIKHKELKRGLYNYEDLHYDEVTGFFPGSFTLYFGDKVSEYIDEEYICLYSSGKEKSRCFIPINYFVVLDWCISLFIKDYFDRYGDYKFTYDEWQALLDKADSILAIDNFDTLFDELIKLQGDKYFMRFKLNGTGADFWKHKQRYIEQLRALREWSNLVLKQGDTMFVIGF